jgi:hypothetical protein
VNRKLLSSKIEDSKRVVADAEKGLAKALRGVESAPRAAKMAVTETVKDALAKLKCARADLEELGKLISQD